MDGRGERGGGGGGSRTQAQGWRAGRGWGGGGGRGGRQTSKQTTTATNKNKRASVQGHTSHTPLGTFERLEGNRSPRKVGSLYLGEPKPTSQRP